MKNLTNSTLIQVKGFLFLFIGTVTLVLFAFERPTLKQIALLALAIWSFCRFYYFAFYVIERYVDPSYRFVGLLSFASYLIRKKNRKS